MDHRWFADEEANERALNDQTGPFDYLPLMHDRAFPDPANPEQLLVCFSYGSASLKFERDAPARVEECLAALTKAHPEFGNIPKEVLLSHA